MARSLLLLLLLKCTLNLGVFSQDIDLRTVARRDYNMAKLSGYWYSVSIASDDMTRISEDGDLRVYIRNIQHLESGDLQFQFDFKVLGHCEMVNMVCEKTDRNGEFTVNYKGENRVLVSETDYNLYVTFYLRNIQNGTLTQVLALYDTFPDTSAGTELVVLNPGRHPDLNPSFLNRFEKICRRHGLGPQNIIKLDGRSVCYEP